MQIHELPSGTPDINDLIPFDTEEANYKAPFRAFEVGENTATFESSDEADPQQFKTVDQVETGPIKTILNRLSMAVSNVRYIWKLLGTSALGTSATTITGAIAELKGQVKHFKCVYMNIGYTDGETILAKVQRAFENSAMPIDAPFIADINSGSRFIMVGYWYPSKLYGYCYIGNFSDFYFFRLVNGEWRYVPNMASTNSTTVSIKIGAGPTESAPIRRFGNVRVLNMSAYGNGTAFGTLNLQTAIGTLETVDIPTVRSYGTFVGLTDGSVAAATYYPVAICVDTDGKILIRGNQTQLASVKYLEGEVVWMVNSVTG